MMRTSPVVQRSLSFVLMCVPLGACELAKRDFADAASSETADDGGAPAERGGSSGETSAAASTPTSGSATALTGPVDNSTMTLDATDSTRTVEVVSPGETTVGAGATEEPPAPGETSAAEQATWTSDGATGSRCDQNVLVNGSFEAGEEGWTPSSSYSAFEQRVHPLIVQNDHPSLANYTVSAQDGTQFAFLGDVPDDEYQGYHTTLTQSVFVPEEASGLALMGYVWVDTDEPPEQEWDIGYVQLESQENADQYWQFTFWSNLNATDGWVKFDEYIDDLDQLRGKHVNLVVQAVTDDNTATRYWFDGLELVVVCP